MSAPGLLASAPPVVEQRDGGSTVTFLDSGRSWAGIHGGLLVGALVVLLSVPRTGRRPSATKSW